jgi:hypothetical protein
MHDVVKSQLPIRGRQGNRLQSIFDRSILSKQIPVIAKSIDNDTSAKSRTINKREKYIGTINRLDEAFAGKISAFKKNSIDKACNDPSNHLGHD